MGEWRLVELGVELIEKFQPILLVFAGILVYSALKILLGAEEDEEEVRVLP